MYSAEDIRNQVRDITADMDPVEAMDFIEELQDLLDRELSSPQFVTPQELDFGPDDALDFEEDDDDEWF